VHILMTRTMPSILCVLAFAAMTTAAQASDHYVDGTNGDNANTGDAPRAAWRTISYALGQMPATSAEAQTIHVAPGVYDAALGEVFPYALQYHSNSQIVGTGGSNATIVDGGGTQMIVLAYRGYHQGLLEPLTMIQGLTLRNAQTGIQFGTGFGPAYLTCRDLKIDTISVQAIHVEATSFNFVGQANGTFEHIDVSNCALGLFVETYNIGTVPAHANVVLTDCSFVHNGSQGILVHDDEAQGATLFGTRLRVVGNASDGIRVEQTHDPLYTGATTSTSLADCLVAQNGGDGVKVAYTGNWQYPAGNSWITTTIRRCTIADNLGAGFDTYVQVMDPTHASATLAGTILYGNGTDIIDHPTQPAIASPSYNDVGQGNFAGANGNISANPHFFAPQTGNYHIGFTSACVDAGDPSTPLGKLDLDGTVRPIDGDLDTIETADIGALEFRPLEIHTSGALGTRLRFALWGESGATTTVYFSRGAPVSPASTPFGELDLDPSSLGTYFGPVSVDPLSPTSVSRRIPNNPALIGRTFSFQALTNSSTAPQGAAYTNVAAVTFIP